MSYKTNKLRMKVRVHSELRSKQGIRGNEVKEQKRIAEAEEMRVVATVRTSGNPGNHVIELLDCGAPMVCWVRIDDRIYRPRTARGFVSLLGRWLWKSCTSSD